MGVTLSGFRTYNGPETGEIILKPALTGGDFTSWFRIHPNVGSKKPINIRQRLINIIQKETTRCSFNASGTITLEDEVLDPSPQKVDLEFCEEDFDDSVFEELWVPRGTNRPDLTQTPSFINMVTDAIIEGMRRDHTRILWWGDDADSNDNWKHVDGFWEILLANSGDIGHTFDMSTVETASALDADAAYDAWKSMFDNIPKEAFTEFGRNNLLIIATSGMVDNYRASLENSFATDAGTNITINGLPRLAFRGIPILEIPEWDVDVADSDNPQSSELNTTSNNVSILTSPRDVFHVATDAVTAAEGVSARIWFSMDDQKVRATVRYKLGTLFPSAFRSPVAAAF